MAFICSSNNNISRITQMVEKLCVHYGRFIAVMDDGRAYHDFPPPESLTGAGVEASLRSLGFGYRAKYISQTAAIVARERERGWLDSLRNPGEEGMINIDGRDGYREAHKKLLELQGVGPKVADCVCLMGLSWGEAVPVDTHIWQIAQRDYKFGRASQKTLSPGTYWAVGNHFRKIWGQEAGWAHSVLFAADLGVFKNNTVPLSEKKPVAVGQENGQGEEKRKGETNISVNVKRRRNSEDGVLKVKEEKKRKIKG